MSDEEFRIMQEMLARNTTRTTKVTTPNKPKIKKEMNDIRELESVRVIPADVKEIKPSIFKEEKTFDIVNLDTDIPPLLEVIKEVFGDNVDFVRNSEIGNHSFIFYWPKVNITSSNGRKHTITDFYIFLPIFRDSNDRYKFCCSLYSARGTKTLKEALCNYSHSHSKQTALGRSSCCLGGGSTPINQSLANLVTKYTYSNLRKVVLSLMGYVTWESIDGGPYIRIEKLQTTDIKGIIGTATRSPLATYNTEESFRIINLLGEDSNLFLSLMMDTSAECLDDRLGEILLRNSDTLLENGYNVMFMLRESESDALLNDLNNSSALKRLDDKIKECNRNAFYFHFKGKKIVSSITEDSIKEAKEYLSNNNSNIGETLDVYLDYGSMRVDTIRRGIQSKIKLINYINEL